MVLHYLEYAQGTGDWDGVVDCIRRRMEATEYDSKHANTNCKMQWVGMKCPPMVRRVCGTAKHHPISDLLRFYERMEDYGESN